MAALFTIHTLCCRLQLFTLHSMCWVYKQMMHKHLITNWKKKITQHSHWSFNAADNIQYDDTIKHAYTVKNTCGKKILNNTKQNLSLSLSLSLSLPLLSSNTHTHTHTHTHIQPAVIEKKENSSVYSDKCSHCCFLVVLSFVCVCVCVCVCMCLALLIQLILIINFIVFLSSFLCFCSHWVKLELYKFQNIPLTFFFFFFVYERSMFYLSFVLNCSFLLLIDITISTVLKW